MDWATTNFYKMYGEIWYSTVGFFPPVEDQPAANAAALANLVVFEKTFLTTGKFIGGDDVSIADYKVCMMLWMLNHPTIKAAKNFELAESTKAYLARFMEVTNNAAWLDAADGFMKSKAPTAE